MPTSHFHKSGEYGKIVFHGDVFFFAGEGGVVMQAIDRGNCYETYKSHNIIINNNYSNYGVAD